MNTFFGGNHLTVSELLGLAARTSRFIRNGITVDFRLGLETRICKGLMLKLLNIWLIRMGPG
jgi:hypothetical protein